MECPETSPDIYDQLSFNKDAKGKKENIGLTLHYKQKFIHRPKCGS